MRNLLKISLISILGFILLLLAAFAALVFLFNPNHYKETMAQAVKERTGYNLSIEGDVHWSLFPALSLSVNHANLTSSPNDSNALNVKIGEIAVSVKLMPLFNKHVEISGVYLNDLDVLIKKNSTGINNKKKKTADLSTQQSSIVNTSTLTSENKRGGKIAKDNSFSLKIQQVKIKNAHFKWENSPSYPDITLVALDSDQVNFEGLPFPLSLKLMLTNQQTPYSGELTIAGNAQISTKTQEYSLDKAKTMLALNSTLPNGRKLSVKSNSILHVSFPNSQFSVDDWNLTLNNLALKGNLAGQWIPEHNVEGSMAIQSFNLYEFLQSIGYEINTSDPAVLDNVKGSFLFNIKGDQLSLHELKTNIDNTQIQGQLAYLNTQNSALDFNLKFEKLNLNRILPSEMGQKTVTPSDFAIKTKPASTPPTVGPSEVEISGIAKNTSQSTPNSAVTPPKGPRVNGLIFVNNLLFGKLSAEQFNATIKRNNSLTTIAPINANFYGGQYNGTIQIDFKNSTPAFTTTQRLQNVQLQLLGKTYNASIAGIANINANLNFYGQDSGQMIKTLSGNMRFDVKNGHIEGGDIIQLLNDAYANYKSKKSNSQTPPGKVTDFDKLSASLQIENGFARCQDLTLDSPLLHVSGNGNINLQTQKIDLSLEASTRATGISELTKLQAMLGTSIPLKVSGDLSHPRIEVDYPVFFTRLAQSQLNKKLNKIGKKMGIPDSDGKDIKEQMKGLGNQLKSLFQS